MRAAFFLRSPFTASQDSPMCFGPSTTGSSTSTSSYPPQLLDAANKNLGFSETLGLGPFNAPTQQIAGFSPDQTSAFGLTRSLAASGNPYLASIQNATRITAAGRRQKFPHRACS